MITSLLAYVNIRIRA